MSAVGWPSRATPTATLSGPPPGRALNLVLSDVGTRSMSASPITVIIARSVLAIWRRRVRLCSSPDPASDEARVRTGKPDGEPDIPLADQQVMYCRFPAEHDVS